MDVVQTPQVSVRNVIISSLFLSVTSVPAPFWLLGSQGSVEEEARELTKACSDCKRPCPQCSCKGRFVCSGTTSKSYFQTVENWAS